MLTGSDLANEGGQLSRQTSHLPPSLLLDTVEQEFPSALLSFNSSGDADVLDDAMDHPRLLLSLPFLRHAGTKSSHFDHCPFVFALTDFIGFVKSLNFESHAFSALADKF